MKMRFLISLIYISIFLSPLFAENELKFPEYKKSKAVSFEMNEKFAISITQNRALINGEGNQSMLIKNKVRDYLNTELIGGIVIHEMPQMNKVVINNEVFGVGEWLEFVDTYGKLVSPIPGVKICVHSITNDRIEFSFFYLPLGIMQQEQTNIFGESLEVMIH